MRLRTQLVLASFVLAILPLTALVVYSYHSSKKALELAYRREAARMTRQMDTRIAAIRNELDVRMAAVTAVPMQSIQANGSGASPRAVADEIAAAMGDSADLVDSVEYMPAHPMPHDAAAKSDSEASAASAASSASSARPRIAVSSVPVPHPAPAAPPAPPTPPVAAIAGGTVSVPPAAADVSIPEIPEPPQSIVIDIPKVAEFRMPPQAMRALADVNRLAGQLAVRNATLSPEEREKLNAELKQSQSELRAALQKADEQRQQMFKLRMQRELERERTAAAREPAREQASESREDAKAAVHEAPPAKPASTEQRTVVRRVTSEAERTKFREQRQKIAMILGREFNVPVESGGEVIGHVSAQISPDEVLRRVLGPPSDDASEIAFAVDSAGHLYTRSDAERREVDNLGIPKKLASNEPLRDLGPDWVVATSHAGGLRIGVARRIGEHFDELRRAAARNFGYGLGLLALAIVGIVPFANHMTRDVQLVTAGAERVAQGDLQTRVPVRSKNEFGQLAAAFNRMAHDLSEQRLQLHREEQARLEQEVRQGILAVEYERKAAELEDARRFQLSMLPKSVPQVNRFDIAAYTRTATEVGGDYYDFHVGEGNALSITIGDATGHGAKAGTMVTVIKTLFSGYTPTKRPSEFLGEAAEKIKRMELGRMSMALSLGRLEHDRLVVASAGMPPVMVHRAASGRIEEIALEATPLGTLGVDYQEAALPLADGDTILFMTDGLPELTNEAGEQLGYVAATEAFGRSAVAVDARGVIEALVAAAHEWHGDQPPNDDITFVAVRVRG